jgi:hypothetical protein
MSNIEKILQRIRMLMKESFFYKKDVLINLIRTPKEYPYIQIYAALTQLIEDKSEVIIDKYDRTGHLINIDDYYLFQPSELTNKNISIFERSVPIDFKHSMVDFQLKQDVVKTVIDNRNIQNIVVDETMDSEGKKIVDDLLPFYDVAINFLKQPRVPRGDDSAESWFRHSGIVMKKMVHDGVSTLDELLEFLVEHILESLLFKEKVHVMNHLYSIDNFKKLTFEWFAKKYFEKNILTVKNIRAFILYDLHIRKTMILNKKNIWELAEPSDEIEIDESKEGKEKLNFNIDNYLNKETGNGIIGFIGFKKKSKILMFKTKDVLLPRDTGASCIESGKSKTLVVINKIIGKETYNKENTKIIKDDNGNITQEAVSESELCVLQEFILRKYNKDKKLGKLWFLTPDMAIHFGIYNPKI